MKDVEAAATPPTASARSAAARGFAVYYALVVTQTVSQIGSQISEYAVGINVFRATGHATPIALVAFFTAAPAVLLGGLTGALADRFDRRLMMLVANLGYAATSGLLLLSFATGAFQLWHLYALTGLAAVFTTLEAPAFRASIAMLTPDSHRDRANAIGQMAGSAAGIVAPAAAGLLYAFVGTVGAIGIAIATFIAAIAVLVVVRIPMPVETAAGAAMQASVWRQVFDGFRYLATLPVLLGLSIYNSLINFFANGAFVLLTPYLLARTGSAQLLGGLLAVMNVGGVVGALLIGAGLRVGSRISTVMLGIAVFGLFTGLAGAARGPLGIGACLFLLYFALAFANAPFWSIMQAKIPPDLQGRVFAANLQLGMFMTPLACLAAGPLADRVFEPARHGPAWRAVGWLVGSGPGAGMGLMFALAGAVILVLTLGVYAVPAVRHLERDLPDYTPSPAP